MASVIGCGLGTIFLGAVAAWAVTRQLRGLHRVAPERPSLAPKRWVLSPSDSAVLHRRIIAIYRVTSAVHLQASPPRRNGGSPRLADELITGALAELVALDDSLARSRALPGRQRRTRLLEMHREVQRVEALCERAIALAGIDHSAAARDARMNDLETLADHLQAARAVVDETAWKMGAETSRLS